MYGFNKGRICVCLLFVFLNSKQIWCKRKSNRDTKKELFDDVWKFLIRRQEQKKTIER